ncbi:hypothetical protein MPL3365_190059 [Mesorhizobium plurifarium]|uniref:Uncharacterized protein n=1 Tax=Mesorhizobium plurifarium TaxID=69974 RepID=A0A090GTS0_MESPL|nr:hypothetical protein MPL3365_190059 [Mesorhizobium plurifarium]
MSACSARSFDSSFATKLLFGPAVPIRLPEVEKNAAMTWRGFWAGRPHRGRRASLDPEPFRLGQL